MKSFLDHLNEEVLPTVQVADGGLDISKPAVRAAINAAIAGVVSQPAVTPYVVFNRLSKLLAQYHIILPKRFLEGDKGVEVFELRQFGHKMGMTDSGEFVNEVPSTHYLFMQYGIISPFGITYAKPIVGGMFKVMARLVDKAELDKLMDMAEITMAEEAEVNQAIAKANAPREEMKDITSDEKKKGNKEAVGASEKGLDEAKMTMTQKRNAIMRFMSHNSEAGKSILKTGEKDRAEKKAFASGKAEINRQKKKEMNEELSHGARELTLHADNDQQLYRSSHQPIIKNLSRKHAKGTYDHDKAGKLWKYHADRAAKSYEKQHGGKFSVADRKAAASHFADSARDEHSFGSVKEDKDPCWKGYEMIGMKKKGGRKVPNCVPVKEEEQIDELTGKGKLPALKAVYKGDKDYHTRSADYHAARADRAERRGEDSKAERHMDAGYGHEHKAERAEAKSKRASALMVRAKANADIKASKAASKSARAEYNEETQIDELKKSTLASYIKKAHVSGLEAASQGEIAYANKDKAGLRAANKTGEKREQGIERAAGKLAREETIAEKAPPGAKYERMVRHIKKGYAKDGELTAKEKGIAFATAWKAKNLAKGE